MLGVRISLIDALRYKVDKAGKKHLQIVCFLVLHITIAYFDGRL